MTHVPILLLTRFSWPHRVWAERSAEAYAAWLDERLDLLERYPVAALRNSRIPPDCWMVFAQAHGADLDARLAAVVSRSGVPAVIVRHDGRSLVDCVAARLAEMGHGPGDQVCTMRMDSDDLVASDYVTRLRTCIDKDLSGPEMPEPLETGLSFPGGCILDTATMQFHYAAFPGNPFIGLLETIRPDGTLATVFKKMHGDLLDHVARVRCLRSDHPMWCSVVHDGNLANQSLLNRRRTPLAGTDQLLVSFGLSPGPRRQRS